MNRIDHTKCQHEATPKARKACRKVQAAKAERVEREARFDADQEAAQPLSDEAMGLLVEPEAPFAKRAIVINFPMKDGKRCSVTFDRYGMNSELYRTALAYRWSAQRTVAQACSEAISAVGKQHGFDNVADYTVLEVD